MPSRCTLIEREEVRFMRPVRVRDRGGRPGPIRYTPLGYNETVGTTRGPLMYGYTMNKKAVSDRLRRIEGQVRGIQRMVEEDQYCVDILTQVNSAASALKSVGMGLLDDHVRHCVRESIETGDSDEKVEELLAAVARFAGK